MMTLQEVEEMRALLKEVAQAPVHVDDYCLPELSCMFCRPTEDNGGIPHHAPTCVVERAKKLLVRCE
jgi:hypothetical protein